MTKRTLFLFLSILIIASGCAYLSSKNRVHSKSYSINVEEQTVIGNPMIISEFTAYAQGRRSSGLVEELDYWDSFAFATKDRTKEELIYNGRSDDIIHITHNSYKKDLKSPKLSQKLTYNLEHSDVIQFKTVKIRILRATPEYVRFVVLSD